MESSEIAGKKGGPTGISIIPVRPKEDKVRSHPVHVESKSLPRAAQVALPAGNTGALNPKRHQPAPVEGVNLLIDWISYTAPEGTTVEQLLPVQPPVAWEDLPHGDYGYRSGRRAGHVSVYWGGAAPGMGVHVVISGQGCRELEAWGLESWRGFLAAINESGWHVSRLDYALDDRAGLLDMAELVTAFRAGAYTSPSLKWSVLDSGNKPGQLDGQTIYLGSPKSATRIRIYDKAAEQSSEPGEHWIRVELQLRDERATQAVAQHVAAGDASGLFVAGLLRRQLDFKAPDSGDSHKSRQLTASWWADFLGGAEKVRLIMAPAVRTLEGILGWLDRQVAPSIALILAAAGGDATGLLELAERGRERWTNEHRWLLEWSVRAPLRAA